MEGETTETDYSYRSSTKSKETSEGKCHHPQFQPIPKIMNGMGGRMDKGISPWFFASSRGGV